MSFELGPVGRHNADDAISVSAVDDVIVAEGGSDTGDVVVAAGGSITDDVNGTSLSHSSEVSLQNRSEAM